MMNLAPLRLRVTHASCKLDDGEASDDGSGTIASSSWEPKSQMKQVSFNLDDGKVFEKYDQKDKVWMSAAAVR